MCGCLCFSTCLGGVWNCTDYSCPGLCLVLLGGLQEAVCRPSSLHRTSYISALYMGYEMGRFHIIKAIIKEEKCLFYSQNRVKGALLIIFTYENYRPGSKFLKQKEQIICRPNTCTQIRTPVNVSLSVFE